MTSTQGRSSQDYTELDARFGAHNYHPLPIVIAKAQGVWVWDVEGKKYMDMLSAYSAQNQGHLHPKIIEAAKAQLDRLTLTSRAFYNDRIAPYFAHLCELTGFEAVLPMNTGAEGVETAIKLARKWGYEKKGIPDGKAEIIVFDNNFHGRTTTIVGFSSDPTAYTHFGPFAPGFIRVPYDDSEAVKNAISPNTAGILVEPIQGEGGVIVPHDGYLRTIRELCDEHNILLICDEIQTGLGRTGKLFAFEHEGIRPDVLILGKALGGGVFPVSAVLAAWPTMEVFTSGTHGSTFGGNPLGCAIATAAIDVIIDERLPERSAEMGEYFRTRLESIKNPRIKEIRAKGLFIGVELHCEPGQSVRTECEQLLELGVLAKDTHEHTIRFAPPLIITKEEIDWAFERIEQVLGG